MHNKHLVRYIFPFQLVLEWLLDSMILNLMGFDDKGSTYITTAQVSASVKFPANALLGCKCKGACIDPRVCACAKLNGSEFPYVSKDGGR